jgi:hypothetical protein
MSDDQLVFNGIDGASGEYLLPPMSAEEVSKIAQGEAPDEAQIKELKFWYQRVRQAHLGPKEGVDPKRLDESGWGVVFAFEDKDKIPVITEALSELLDLRKQQAGDHYKQYTGPDAYRPDESKSAFLARHGMGPGPADPAKVPYYLLIVGDPETIPYRFQYQMDVQYAVGRIHFDTPEEYAQYARSVVAAETGQVALPRRAAFFGVRNDDDDATNLSAEHLVAPLVSSLGQDMPDWTIESFLADEADKARLAQLLGGDQTPALLFTASHGVGFPLGDPRQLPLQGALVCQDWPGPLQHKGQIPQDFFFAGDDLDSDARLTGLLAFHFACYGAGTPRLDDFAHRAFKKPTPIAPHAFVANLPRRLLSHPKGGALATVGHVERAWPYSFMWDRAGAQVEVFRSTLQRLMEGHPVGSALEFFNVRYAELSTVLSDQLEDIKFGKVADDMEVAGMWTANNDARSYAIIGDPAVRLPVVDGSAEEAERPVIEVAFQASAPAVTQAEAEPIETETTLLEEAATKAAGVASFGLLAVDKDTSDLQDRLASAVQRLVDRLDEALDQAADLEVKTYVAADMSQVPGDLEQAASLRAYSQVNLGGDTQVVIPQQEGEMNELLWAVHADSVDKAQANRVEMLQMVASASSALLEILRAARS